ncbi:hypothetical protein RvY_13275 [Ramazzottius varieornatus]|uniref:BHLH domain-containing protein n=1 Tax=Ramazzottius varieornatus TaxID=947166 RepID=A0A1D1VSN8_RAMVA|nr:hypothetical protein RvY_13275 [Ramazzottius varieornatus]
MKAMVMPICKPRPVSPRKVFKCQGIIRKSRRFIEEGEEIETMELLFQKLLYMIPTLPKDREVSRLEILQHVIEYIQDLEFQVQSHPDAGNLCSGLTYLRISLQSNSSHC